MVSGKTVAYGVGALMAAEATGVTNFSGGGGSGPIVVAPGGSEGGGSSPIPIPVGGNSGGSGGGGSAPAIDLGGIGEAFSSSMEGVTSLASNQSDLVSEITELRTRLEQAQDAKDTVTETTDEVRSTWDKFNQQSPGKGGDGGAGNNGLTDRQKAAKDEGRDPFGLQATQGGLVGGIAEGLRAAGETSTDVVDSIGRPGRDPESGTFFGTVSDAGRTTGEAFREATNWQRDERDELAGDLDKAAEWSNKAADTLNPFKKGFI